MKNYLLFKGTALGSLLTVVSAGYWMTAAVASYNPLPTSISTSSALPSVASDRLIANNNLANKNSVDSVIQSVFNQINQYRQKKGLPALKLHATLNQQAIAHSQAMANKKVAFGHQNFDQRAQTIGKSLPYRSIAENVSYNLGYKDPATQAVQGWIKSSGHRKNIEGNHNLTGIGVARNAMGEYYFTQIFIRSR